MKWTDTAAGTIAFAFFRVFVAALVASWTHAGLPIRELSGGEVVDWIELALQAAAALVIANYLGPWEKRYGVNTGQDANER